MCAGINRLDTCCLFKHCWLLIMLKRKRISYDTMFKTKATDLMIRTGNHKAAFYHCIESMAHILTWRKQRGEPATCPKAQKAFRSKKARWREWEIELEEWVSILCAVGCRCLQIDLNQGENDHPREGNRQQYWQHLLVFSLPAKNWGAFVQNNTLPSDAS